MAKKKVSTTEENHLLRGPEVKSPLTELLRERGYSQSAAADAVGMRKEVLSSWCTAGTSKYTKAFRQFLALAKLCNVTPEDLLAKLEENDRRAEESRRKPAKKKKSK